MKIKPIEIKIKDNWRFCLIAWLVDRKDFLQDIQTARKQLGIDTLVDHKNANKWFKNEYQKYNDPKQVADPLSGGYRYVFPTTKSEKIAKKLLKKYHKSPLYFEAVRSAIVTGKITDQEFSRTAFCQILPSDYQMIDTEHNINYTVDHDQPVMTIVISPETTLKEVTRIFKEEVPYLRNEYLASYLKARQLTPDVIGNIKRDREWYWLHEQGMSYKNIFDKRDVYMDDRDGVVKAIRRYEKRLAENF